MNKLFVTAISALTPTLAVAGVLNGTIPEPSVLGLLAAGVIAAALVTRGNRK